MATQIEVTFAKSQTLPEPVPEGRLQLVDESAGATEVEAYVGTQNGAKKITDKDKANIADLKDGTLVPKLADNLTPYAEDSGTTQTQPFFLEGTATGNGESRVDAKQVPAFAFLQEKRGNVICVNQRSKSFDEIGYTAGQWTFPTVDWATVNKTADSITYTITSVPSESFVSIATCWGSPTVGHTYLALCDISSNSTGSWFARTFVCNVPQWTNSKCYVVTPSSSSSNYFQFTLQSSGLSIGDIITLKKPKLIDLTQWFNGNIPAYLLSHPEAFGRYYKGPLTYEPGRLEPATGRYLTSVGRNIWDEEWESGSINSTTGEKEANADVIRSKNYIPISPSTEYYGKIGTGYINACFYDANKNFISARSFKNTTFMSPANAYFMLFRFDVAYGTTYNNDVTISLYYSGESGYDQHYLYEVLANVDTGTEPLYSAGSAHDVKTPDGTITRNVGSVDLGTLIWNYNSSYGFNTDISNLNMRKLNSNYIRGNLQCSEYVVETYSSVAANQFTKAIAIGTTNFLLVNNSAYSDVATFKAAMSGVYLYYELATPTTEQGTPFQETVPIDDFGQLSWSDTDVPQGNQIFYPVDYKAAIDTLINYTDGDMTSLVRKTDYPTPSVSGVVKMATASDSGYGIYRDSTGLTKLVQAGNQSIKSGNQLQAITPTNQHQSVFYGLSRAAGVNLASSTEETAPDGTNPGVYPAAAKSAIQNMLGITDLIGNINTVLDSVNGVVI